MAINLDELPQRLRKGEELAFKDFMLVFGLRLRRLFRCWGLPLADAESLATSCLTDIALKVDQFSPRGPGSFERWALRLARTAWIDAWRKREQAHPLADPARYWYEPADSSEPDPEVEVAVAKGLATLSETDRTIVRLRHLERELSFADIADKLGLNEGAVRVRHHRALKKLESFLSGHPAVRAWQQQNGPMVAQEKLTHE